MTEDTVLVALSEEVVELIDENRDDLSRWKFIEFCVDRYFEGIKEEEAEYKEKLNERIAKDRVLVQLSNKVVELVDENRDDLSRWKFIEFCVNKYSEGIKRREREISLQKEEKTFELQAKSEKKEDKILEVPWKHKFDSLWLGAFLFYGAGDVFSSYLAFGNPWAVEGNPVLKYLFGDNAYAFIPFKIAILVSLFLVSYYYLQNKLTSLFIPVLLILIGVLISINNFLYYIQFDL